MTKDLMIVFVLLTVFSTVLSISQYRSLELLSKYGYVDLVDRGQIKVHNEETSLVFKVSYKDSVKKFQRFFHFNETGIMTTKQKEMLMAKRCGNPDLTSSQDKFSVRIPNKSKVNGILSRQKRYNFDDIKMRWHKKELTWKIASYPTSGLLRNQVQSIFTKAFNMWSKHIDIDYRKVTPYEDADIIIEFGKKNHGDSIPFDGRGMVLAHAFYPSGSKTTTYSRSGDAHFDDDEEWTSYDSIKGKSLLSVAVHELGHSMGLGHSGEEKAIMYPYYIPPYRRHLKLDKDDIDGMTSVYGRAKLGKTLPNVNIPDDLPWITQPPAPTEAPPLPKIDICNATIDTVIMIREVEIYVFSGLMMWRVDYSKMVTNWISYEIRDGPDDFHYYWPVIPNYIRKIDASVERLDQSIYMFSGRKFWVVGDNVHRAPGVPVDGLSLTDIGLPSYLEKIDTIFRWGHNKAVYIFAGRQYWKLDESKGVGGHVYPRYPRYIHSVWKNVPLPVKLAFTGLHKNTFFVRDNLLYQFNNLKMTVDSAPKPFKVGWMGCKA